MKTILILLLTAVSVSAGGWSAEYSDGVNISSTPTGIVFNFPSGNGHVNLIGRDQGQIPFKATITIKYRITGKTQFKSLDDAPSPPSLKPNFRPMIFNGDWFDNNGRWWPTGSYCAFLVADGQVHTYTVKCVPWKWTNVQGKGNADAFKKCLQNTKRIYLAFGGGNSFSHGVSDGGAKFELLGFSIK